MIRSAPHRHDMKTLIELTEQGRRDIAELLAAEARSAPQVHEHAAEGDRGRRDEERRADPL
jgi:hypothetical protein